MSRKKLLLIGFIIILLIAIPVTIFLVKQQQDTRSKAAQATILSLIPASTATTPLQKNKDDIINFDVYVDPGVNQNLVSFVKLELLFDPSKLSTEGAKPEDVMFKEDPAAMTVLEGPVYTPGKMVVTLSVGVDPTKVIQTKTKIATVSFKAIDGTGDTPTEISFGSSTQVLSAGSNDQTNENVLSSTEGAFITIAGEVTNVAPTATATPPVGAATATPTPSPSPIVAVGTPVPTSTVSATVTPGGTSTPNTAPVCTALSVDRSTTGTAPYAITFTASGTDSDGTISKVTFSYGDGQVENVTQGGGIATSSVNASAAHTYQNVGSYTASVILTDNNGGVSSGNCTQAITVQAASTSGGGSVADATPTTAIASLPSTGPGDMILGAGAIIGILTFIGGALFFVL